MHHAHNVGLVFFVIVFLAIGFALIGASNKS